jgi:hypothetical protein
MVLFASLWLVLKVYTVEINEKLSVCVRDWTMFNGNEGIRNTIYFSAIP